MSDLSKQKSLSPVKTKESGPKQNILGVKKLVPQLPLETMQSIDIEADLSDGLNE